MISTRSCSALFLVGLLALPGCASDDSSDSFASPSSAQGGPGAVGVSQGGAQDFGLFRQILERGEIPGPETLDDVGFFAEHKLDYPAPECGDELCMHGLVGMMGNMITGANCTLLQIGLNSPLDIASVKRPPMHLVLSVDVSGSMSGQPLSYLRQGLIQMVDELGENDRVSLVTFSDKAKVVLEAVPATEKEKLKSTFQWINAAGATNLYDGLFSALELTEKFKQEGEQPRVIFLSDGEATTGLTSSAKIRGLASAYARKGTPISSIGVGKSFDVELMKGLGEVGAGNFYFLEDPSAVAEVFVEEVATFLYPVALDVTIQAQTGMAYELRSVYGTKNWESGGNSATISIPSLFLAGRTKASEPIEGGRRGGGGAIVVEVVPRGNNAAAETALGNLAISWKHPTTGETVSQVVDLSSPYTTQSLPKEGYFTSFTSEKGFVMLNILAGFQLAAASVQDNDARGADATLAPLEASVMSWLQKNPDPDIEDDLKYLRLFRKNLGKLQDYSSLPPAIPQNPWPVGD